MKIEQIFLSFFLVLCFTLSFVICNPTDTQEDDEDLCGQDVCQDGEECVDDTCRAAAATPDLCGKQVCKDGQECIEETCMAAVDPPCGPNSCKNEGELCKIKDSRIDCKCPAGLEVVDAKCIDKKCVNVSCDWNDQLACFRGKCYNLCTQKASLCNSTTICKADKKPNPKHICVPKDIPTGSTNKGSGNAIDTNSVGEAENHKNEDTSTGGKQMVVSRENKTTIMKPATKQPAELQEVKNLQENITTTMKPSSKQPVEPQEAKTATMKPPSKQPVEPQEVKTTTVKPTLKSQENITTTMKPPSKPQEAKTATMKPSSEQPEVKTTTVRPSLNSQGNITTTIKPPSEPPKEPQEEIGSGSEPSLQKSTTVEPTLGQHEDKGTTVESTMNSQVDEEDVQPKNDESTLSSNFRPRQEETSSSGSFPVLFMATIALVIGAYFVYHNRAKVLGMVVEGRNGKEGRGGTRSSYQKLKNVEEAMPGIRGNHAA